MPLKAILDSLDDVPEAIRNEYKQDGDRYVLAVDGINEHPSVLNLKTAHERQKAMNAELKQKLAETAGRYEGLPDDFSVEMFEELRQRAEGKAAPNMEELAQARQRLEQKHAKELKALQEQLEAERGVSTRLIVDDGLTKALVNASVRKELLKGAHAMLRGMVKVVEEDGKRAAVVETDMGPQPLDRFVAEWATSEEGRAFVAQPSGGAAAGGNAATSGAKTIKRSQFDAMSQAERHGKIKEGFRVVEG